MAFPDYSLMIREQADSVTGFVIREALIFTDAKDAIYAYNQEVSSPFIRVFLFVQPQPTKFKRNDNIAILTHIDQWD